jgi:hypothetical protein
MKPANDNDPTKDYRLQVYFIESVSSGAVKIGIARAPDDRLKQLQTGNHEQLRLVAAVYGHGDAQLIEQTMHDLLKPWHIRGEWFEGKWHEIFRAHKLSIARAQFPKIWDRYWAYAKTRQNSQRLINGWKMASRREVLILLPALLEVPGLFEMNSPQMELQV